MNPTLSNEIGVFWRWFVQRSSTLRTIRSADDAAYAELEREVAGVSSELGVEIGGDDESNDMSLIFTAHGNENVFPIVDALVERAPRIDGWQIHALKPPLSEDFELEYDGGALRLSDIWFKTSGMKLASGRLPIQIGCHDFKNDERKDAALLALESFLGERAFAASIEIEGLLELPGDPMSIGFLPVMRLREVLALH
jgi:hypothetical protein